MDVKDTTKLILWLPKQEYTALSKLAAQEYRPVHNQAILVIRQALEQAGLLQVRQQQPEKQLCPE